MEELALHLGIDLDYSREIWLFGLILARTLPMIFITPFMAGQQAPLELKMGLSVIFALLILPLGHESLNHALPLDTYALLLLMAKEALIGFTMGYTLAHLSYAVETAGRLIDTARGAAMSEVLMPNSQARATPIGTMYTQLLLIFFMIIGGHRIFLNAFFNSFVILPVEETIDLTPGLSAVAEYILRVSGQTLTMAMVISAPALAATFLTDVVFGVLNRVASQLNAHFMSMPIKAMGALLLILISMKPFLERLETYIHQSLVAAQKVIELFAHG